MNVLITGGAGYVGTELLASLALNKEITKITLFVKCYFANIT